MTLILPDYIEDELTALELLLEEDGHRHLMRIRAFMLQQETMIERARELADFVQRTTAEQLSS